MARYLLAMLLLCVAGTTSAQTPDTVLFGEAELDGTAGKATIIIRTGGTGQNGPHMAIGKHNVPVAPNAEASALRSATRWWRPRLLPQRSRRRCADHGRRAESSASRSAIRPTRAR